MEVATHAADLKSALPQCLCTTTMCTEDEYKTRHPAILSILNTDSFSRSIGKDLPDIQTGSRPS